MQIHNKMRQLLRAEEGATLIFTATVIFVLLAAAGLSVDYGRGKLAEKRMQQALDTTALALATEDRKSPIADLVSSGRALYINNYNNIVNDNYLGANITSFTAVKEVGTTTRYVLTIGATMPSTIMQVFNQNTLTIAARSVVELQPGRGADIVFSFDHTKDGRANQASQLAVNMLKQIYGDPGTSTAAENTKFSAVAWERNSRVPYLSDPSPSHNAFKMNNGNNGGFEDESARNNPIGMAQRWFDYQTFMGRIMRQNNPSLPGVCRRVCGPRCAARPDAGGLGAWASLLGRYQNAGNPAVNVQGSQGFEGDSWESQRDGRLKFVIFTLGDTKGDEDHGGAYNRDFLNYCRLIKTIPNTTVFTVMERDNGRIAAVRNCVEPECDRGRMKMKDLMKLCASKPEYAFTTPLTNGVAYGGRAPSNCTTYNNAQEPDGVGFKSIGIEIRKLLDEPVLVND